MSHRNHLFIAIAFLLALALLEGIAFAGGLVIDPGHGGYEFGAVVANLKEKDGVLALARRIEALAQRDGRAVTLTRGADTYVSLADRRRIVQSAPSPKTFISLHMTQSDSLLIYTALYPDGIKYSPPRTLFSVNSRQIEYLARSKSLAHLIEGRADGALNLKSTLREMSATLLGMVSAPAVMMEIPARLIKDETRFDDIAHMILDAVAESETDSGQGGQ